MDGEKLSKNPDSASSQHFHLLQNHLKCIHSSYTCFISTRSLVPNTFTSLVFLISLRVWNYLLWKMCQLGKTETCSAEYITVPVSSLITEENLRQTLGVLPDWLKVWHDTEQFHSLMLIVCVQKSILGPGKKSYNFK